jgi:hypothetical protein
MLDFLADGRARDNMIALDIALAFRKSDTALRLVMIYHLLRSSTLWQGLYKI